MNRAFFSLAVQGALRKRRSSLLIFFVLLLSLACMIVSLSVTGSITKTNEALAESIYGSWKYAIAAGRDEDAAWLEEQKAAGELAAYGTMRSYGALGLFTDQRLFSRSDVGTVDAEAIRLGSLSLQAGRWPEAPNEIVLEERALAALGYDDTLGQTLTLDFELHGESSSVSAFDVSYTLVGVLRNYTNLWILNQNNQARTLPGAILTQEGAERLQQIGLDTWANTPYAKEGPLPTHPLYLIEAPETDRGKLGGLLKTYLSESRAGTDWDTAPCTNPARIQGSGAAQGGKTYMNLIALVTALAVLCVYITHLPAETHSAATLRSLGCTRPQLALLMALETLALALPAALLAVPLGVLGTKLALRLLVFTDSVPVQVAIPYGRLAVAALLWAAALLAARLVLFAVAVQAPLTGQFALQTTRARQLRRLRTGLLAVLLMLYGMTVLNAKLQVLVPETTLVNWSHGLSTAHYTITRTVTSSERAEGLTPGTVPVEGAEFFRAMPGVQHAYGLTNLNAGLSFPGMEERTVRLVALDDAVWAEAFGLAGEARAAFHDGTQALLCLPGEDLGDFELTDYNAPPEQRIYLRPDEDISNRDYLLPEGEVTLHLYSDAGEPIGEQTLPVSVHHISRQEYTNYQGLMPTAYCDPYTIVCSHACLEQLLAQAVPGQQWGACVTGAPYGYEQLCIRLDSYANVSLTDTMATAYCFQNGLYLSNRRETISSIEVQTRQKVILNYASGLCIGLTLLLLLAGLYSMQAELQKRSTRILRALGMPVRQLWARLLAQALGCGLAALAGGSLLEIGLLAHSSYKGSRALGRPLTVLGALWDAATSLPGFVRSGLTPAVGLALVLLAVLPPLVLALGLKARLVRESRLENE